MKRKGKDELRWVRMEGGGKRLRGKGGGKSDTRRRVRREGRNIEVKKNKKYKVVTKAGWKTDNKKRRKEWVNWESFEGGKYIKTKEKSMLIWKSKEKRGGEGKQEKKSQNAWRK